jgi:branched-chain amino acid transport system permease protein
MLNLDWATVFLAMGIHIIMALSFYLAYSCGLISLAQAGFMAIGAYLASWMTVNEGWEFYSACLLGGGAAAVVGTLAALPALRIRGIYLLLLTLGINEIIIVFFYNFEPTGGAEGFYGMKGYTQNWNVWLLVAVLLFFFDRLERSRVGRAFEAVHADEEAADLMGVNLTTTKVQAFALSAFIAGIGGAFWAHFTRAMEPVNFNVFVSIEFIIFVFVGGMRTYWGAVAGTALLTLLDEVVLRNITIAGVELRGMAFGAILVLMMIFRPEGLLNRDPFRFLRKRRAAA